MKIVLSNNDMDNERYATPCESEYDNYATYSVEYGANNYDDDLYNGTLDECIAYINAHIAREDAETGGLQIAEISINADGLTDYCYGLITDLDEIYRD